MFLDSPAQTLEVSFRVKHGDGSHMVYASSGQMKCFECGDVGHKRFACSHKQQAVHSPESAAVAAPGGASAAVGPGAVGSDKIKAAVQKLETDIKNIEEGLQRDSGPTVSHRLQEKRLELSSLLQERVKGALVRFRFLQLKDMDALTSFFFNLERSVAQGKQMTCLELPGGRVTTSPGEMRGHATDFYSGLFGAEQCSMQCCGEPLEGLPQLSPEEKAALDCELTLEELTMAVNQMASGRAQRIDGLSQTFFKRFWNTLGPDLHAVLLECFGTGSLPVSCIPYKVWQIFKIARNTNETPGMWLFEEPLFFNDLIKTQALQSASLQARFSEAGCTKLGHLMRAAATSVDTLRENSRITSFRLINRVVEEVCAAL
ncbi:hypothetical protein L3Q82_021594 [Scortum barcoo]|uniref:Uncharacterized protein n=1 Tax=Scortum barcoo TaxID=214431 RepID=A0ACB8X544_9TELE|nr:hypothetical protein L3Q82_021594 [Scortum barcoo]